MGVGKSTTAAAVADRLGLAHRDSDVDIETLFGHSGVEIAADRGVDELHRLESAVLLGALASPTPMVISAAAWVVEDPACLEALAQRARVVVLQASVAEVMRRAQAGEHRRLIDRETFEALAERRAPMFESVADLRLDAMRPTGHLVASIVEFWHASST